VTLALISITTDFPTWICFLALLVGWGAFSQGACSNGSRALFARAVCGLAGASCAFCSRFVRPSGSLPVRREPPVLGHGDRPPCRMFSLDQGVSSLVVRYGLSCTSRLRASGQCLPTSPCTWGPSPRTSPRSCCGEKSNINEWKILCFL